MTNLTILSKDIRTLDGLYSLNDLHKASGGKTKHQPSFFLRNAQTKELIEEINCSANLQITFKAYQSGANRGTWVCKELVYFYAMWISAKFHLKVIRAFDAWINTPPRGVTLTEKQAGFVKCSFNLMDKLQSNQQQTMHHHQIIEQQLTMIRSACDQVEENLKQLNPINNGDYGVMNHVHLYKGMAMNYEGAHQLKDFIERKH